MCFTAGGYPARIEDVAIQIGQPSLTIYARRFAYQYLNPDEPLPSDEELPKIPSRIRVFHSAQSVFHSPSDVSGFAGMRRETIHSTPNWHGTGPRCDTVLLLEDRNLPGMRGLTVARVHLFFTFKFRNDVIPCIFVDHFRHIGNQPDPVTGMWVVAPHIRAPADGGGCIQTVEHLDSIVRAVHLIPRFGEGFLPDNWPRSLTLDAFSQYYVNKYADHHLHELLS